MTETDHSSRPPIAIASIILSMALLGVGNGLLFAYVPVRLSDAGFPLWVPGAVVTGLASGAIVGCLMAGWLVGRVGHARAFAFGAALIVLSVLMIALAVDEALWIGSRSLYGVASMILFVVTQSWLNDASPNHWRGKVIGAFYMIYVVAIGFGSFLLRYVSLEGADAPLLAIFFTTLGILPVSLTRLAHPPPPAAINIAIRSVWKISPVGLMGMVAVGGLALLVQGFSPIYFSDAGYAKDDVGLLMFLMQFGMIGVQYPLGAISDRMDRRIVLIVASLMVIVAAVLASRADVADFITIAVIFAVWAGATESIYSLANAHANDRAEPQYYVSLSSTMLIAWSVSGLVLPGIATALTPWLGARAFMYVAAVIALLYGVFVAYRIAQREQVAEDSAGTYRQISAQAPYPAELSPQIDETGEPRP